MKELVNKFKALGDETRFKLFLLLSEKQICVKGLAEILQISESAVSQHLKVLRDAGLIKGEKVGYFTHYKVQKNILIELQNIIKELSRERKGLEEEKKALGINLAVCNKVCQQRDSLMPQKGSKINES